MTKPTIRPMEHPDQMIKYWMREKWTAIAIVIFGIGFNGLMAFAFIYQGKLIDAIIEGGTFAIIVRAALVFIGIVASIQIMRYFKRYYVRRFANITSATMRKMLYNNIMHKSITELDQENMGNLMTRAVSDVDLCVEGMRKFTTELFDTGVLMIAYAIALMGFDVRLTLLSVLFIPIAMILADQLKGVIYKYSTAYRKKSSEIADVTYDRIENAMQYRITGMEIENRKGYETDLIDLEQKSVKANIFENSMQPIYNAISLIGILAVIYIGGIKVIDGLWSIGEFSAYLAMFLALAVKASKASKLFNSVQKSQVSWKRIKPYMKAYIEKSPSTIHTNEPTKLIINDLSLNYGDGRPNVIDHMTFEGKQGEIIGITGPIASGKSTLGLALTGLYPYLGSIQVNGKELRDYSETERSSMISYLGHRPQLLSDTIRNNISLGDNLDITNVIQDVAFESDLIMMPHGLETMVGNSGVRLSGGQQARIALARALVKKSKIIILDDPFSAIDMKTEDFIIRTLRSHYPDSIFILISHRLAIFQQIDRIIFMLGDKTFTTGTHRELMKSSQLYSTIFHLQSLEAGEANET